MADIRIKDLATTAASTASDDFIAVDGSANGTRKLNAYSPTFGGNLTVSGTGTSSVAGSFGVGAASPVVGFSGNEAAWIVGANRTDGGSGLYPILLTLNDNRAYNSTNPSPGGGLGFTYKYNTAGNYASGVTIQGFKENTTDGDYAGGLRFLTRANAAQPAEAMRITSSGNLLIGTTTASGVLTINKAASDTISAANAAAFIGQPDTFQVGLLMQQTLSAPYSFALQATRPNGANQFPISLNPSGGNVLVGTTTDGGQKLQVSGVVNSSGAGYTNSGYQITNTTASRTTGWFQNNSGTTILRDVTGAADLLSVDTSGNATFVGSIAIGNTVQTAVAIASTHKVTISIGGSTYYLLATNV